MEETIELGTVSWYDKKFKKIARGGDWRTLDYSECDVWGITANFYQERDAVCAIIKHLSLGGAKVVVGGSDVFADPETYINSGAIVAVLDKSGGSNIAAIELALTGKTEKPCWVFVKDLGIIEQKPWRLHPNNWALPSLSFVKQTLVEVPWKDTSVNDTFPMGPVTPDHACNRRCDFCQSWTYRIPYEYMSAQKVLEWIDLEVAAGARSIINNSDQFLGRVLWREGRKEVLTIMNGIKERRLKNLWWNGLEIQMATMGRGMYKPGHSKYDPRPDLELVSALWGYDGKAGCGQAFLPAERPLEGNSAYRKLLPWLEHVEMVKAIVRAGVPDITYALIIGLPNDTDDSLKRLLEAVQELRNDVLTINPNIQFAVIPSCFIPFPGTELAEHLAREKLIMASDPALFGKWTPVTNTHHLSSWNIHEWQGRFYREFMPKQYADKTISSLGGTEQIFCS